MLAKLLNGQIKLFACHADGNAVVVVVPVFNYGLIAPLTSEAFHVVTLVVVLHVGAAQFYRFFASLQK